MIGDLDEVQWAYLLDPAFELVNTAGKPLTDGWIEVYIHGTRNKYYCAKDFDGTLHEFKIPLDSLGSNIVLASPAHAYDVYVYNKFGSLVMSRYNVVPATGDGVSVAKDVLVVGTDESIKVDTTYLHNGVKYDIYANTNIIATNEYVNAEIKKEANARSEDDELIRKSIPTKTSQIDNDSGFFNTDDIHNGRTIILLKPLQKYSNYIDINYMSTRFSGYIDNKLRIALFGTSIHVMNSFTPEYSPSDGVGTSSWPAIAYFEIPNFVADNEITSVTTISNMNITVAIQCKAGSNKFGVCLNAQAYNSGWYDLVTIPIMF